jgi:methyl-accepting chemotaxis protein
MDEHAIEQMNESARRLADAAEALQQTLTRISAQQDEISAKVEKIVAAIEEGTIAVEANNPAVAKEATTANSVPAGRKTLSPLVAMILAKSGVEEDTDTTVLDKALSGLSPEQRIAVKSEMARAGIIQ